MDINTIVQTVVQGTLAANAASVMANSTNPSLAPTLPQPAGGHQPLASDNFFLIAWNGYQDSFPIFQARIRAWFKSPSFEGVTNFTKKLPGTKHQSSLLRLCLISDLLTDKVLSIFLHIPAYEHDRFRMWGCILEKYNPRGKDALFESVSALYTLEQTVDETIINYMSCSCRFFISLHGTIFNTMAKLFVIVNSDLSCFGAIANRIFARNPEVVNEDVERLETLLEAKKSRS